MTQRHGMTRLGTARGAGRAVRDHGERPASGWPAVILRVAGSGLLIATAAIHLHPYLTRDRTIPVIGWLFLLPGVAALRPRPAGVALPPPPRTPQPPGAATAPGWVEMAAFVVLPALALAPARATAAAGPARFPTQIPPAAARAAGVTAAGLAVAALVLFGLVVAGASSPPPAATGTGLKTATIGGTTVLTNAKGFTLYSFAPDTPATSKCYGSCAAYWPPVTGTPAASSALPGRVGTLKRTNGSEQLTYNGHPLYTYVGDSAPGQARGNNLNLNGGLWQEIRVSR